MQLATILLLRFPPGTPGSWVEAQLQSPGLSQPQIQQSLLLTPPAVQPISQTGETDLLRKLEMDRDALTLIRLPSALLP